MKGYLQVIGLMSGTSLDGVDVALLKTDGEYLINPQQNFYLPYSLKFRDKLKRVIENRSNDEAVAKELTQIHIEAIEKFLEKYEIELKNIDLIGFHGQTIFHDPANKNTLQIGVPQLMADKMKTSVIFNFRQNDIANGGQGAPLAPIYHLALSQNLKRPVCFINIGGISNLSYLGEDREIIAFDAGPGNALINDWVSMHTDHKFDENGKLAASGKVHEDIVQKYLDHQFFALKSCKSLDRNDFNLDYVKDLNLQDGAATLTEFTARAIAKSTAYIDFKPRKYYVCGGGRHNKFLMTRLEDHLKNVRSIESLGINGDYTEAEAFAFLAARSYKSLPISFPKTTGVKTSMTGGVLYRPKP